MKYFRALLYWIYPQQGAIEVLKRMVKNQEALIQTIRAQKQSIQVENDQLWRELEKLRWQLSNK